jgi:hypothetical protein
MAPTFQRGASKIGSKETEPMKITELLLAELDVTLRDPAVYASPWTTAVNLQLAADTELLEYVCNENEQDRPHLVK